MSELHKALGDIESIRKQMAQTTEFRGYGPATLATTAIFAVAAAVFQSAVLPQPSSDIAKYLAIWIFTAVVSSALTAVQMWTRAKRIHSGLSQEMILMAV